MADETQGQRARRNLRKVFTDIGVGPTGSEVSARNRRQKQVQKSATQGPPSPKKKKTTTVKNMGPKENVNARRARNTTVRPVPPKPTITAKQRWGAMGEQSKAARVQANKPPEPLPNNTFTQTDAYSRRRVNDTRNQSSGITMGSGSVRGGAFQPRDTAMGRRALGLPSRAQQQAQRVQSGGRRQNVLRQGQTRLNLPAANAERMAAADLRRSYANQRRRNASEGSAVRLQANSRLMENQVDNMTDRRGQDISATTAYRGQDVTARGQDISADTQRRGQDVTARGQDLNYDATLQGHDVTRRGQDVDMRGQNMDFDTSRRMQDVTMRGQDSRQESYKYGVDAGVYNSDQRNLVDRERTGSMAQSAANELLSEQDQETYDRASTQIEMMAPRDDEGNINTQWQARAHSVLQEAGGLPEEFRGVTMQSIGEITNILDQLNQQQLERGGDKRISLSDLHGAEVGENKLGFFESLLQGHMPGFMELNIPGFKGFDSKDVNTLRSREVGRITGLPSRDER